LLFTTFYILNALKFWIEHKWNVYIGCKAIAVVTDILCVVGVNVATGERWTVCPEADTEMWSDCWLNFIHHSS
jgi:hypothetical protein